MSIVLAGLRDFMTLFSGRTNAYGVRVPAEEPEPGKKAEGKCFTVQKTLTDKEYEDHLNGKQGLGIIPIREDNTCFFSVIDVDVYGKAHTDTIAFIKKNNIPVLPFRSKSGGLHLYVFYATAVKAIEAINVMNNVRVFLGLPKNTEIFPKQSAIASGAKGNWINLPYFHAAKPAAYMMDESGEKIGLEKALSLAMRSRIAIERLYEIFESLPMSDAPPCIQAVYMRGDTTNRNNYLFSCAAYLKQKHGDDFEFPLMEINNSLADPLKAKELNSTVIESHKKKTWAYACTTAPMVDFCDKDECKKRRYGIHGIDVSNLSFGDFVQYDTHPPYYEWTINDKPLRFFSEAEIIQQSKFRELCFQRIHIMPFKLSDVAWTRILNQALSNIIVKHVSEEDDISPGALFKEYLTEFLTRRAMAETKRQIITDRVYLDRDLHCYVFKPKNLLHFLTKQKDFKYFGQTAVQAELRELGGEPKQYYIDPEHKSARVWTIPINALSRFIEAPIKDTAENFAREYQDEEY